MNKALRRALAPARRPALGRREAVAVALGCAGCLSLLALFSYAPGDMSLAGATAPRLHNWVGPWGAAWSDLMLQLLGLGAYALSLAVLVAAGRALRGRRILPGLREVAGLSMGLVAFGALAHLVWAGPALSYPAGGLPGVLLGPLLRARFARLGGTILASSACLMALAIAADGILLALGARSLLMTRRFAQQLRRLGRQGARCSWRAGDAFSARWGWLRRPRLGRGPWALAAEPRPAAHASRAYIAGPPPPAPARRPKALAARPTPSTQDIPPELAVPSAEPTLAEVAVGEATPPPAAPQIVEARPDLAPPPVVAPPAAAPRLAAFTLPPTSLLDYKAPVRAPVDPDKLRDNALRLTMTLKDYGIDGHVREIRPGPVVTLYEYVPGPGIKLSKIAGLADDLAMSMEALRVRIVAPIPGKGAVGIEIPNEVRETVFLKEIIAQPSFIEAAHPLTMALGKNIEGGAYVANLARMPHLLVAGATGAGKSVSVNAMIMSVLFKATPAEVRMIMVDPKMLELSVYEGIPHLLLPVVTDPKKAALALRWAVAEMERRYELLSMAGARSIDAYNTRLQAAPPTGEPKAQPLPYLLVVVDELADLMMVASRDVETSIMRLAQMARAAGIHLILATQRPSVDVLTGVIKANFPTRIAFQVASRHDSRTILDGNGAEHLLGFGDMLVMSPGAGGLLRVHGAYVSDQEIERAVAFVKEQGQPQYDESILAVREDSEEAQPGADLHDEMYDQAVALVAQTRQASISMIQRRLRIGYNRSARLVERMELEGVVGPADGIRPRDVLVGGTEPGAAAGH